MKGFTIQQLQLLKNGLEKMFEEIGVNVSFSLVETSARSSSLYIKFNDRLARTVRISNHKPAKAQEEYLNIYTDRGSDKVPESRISQLRQWINEKPKDRLVTNKDIEMWLYGENYYQNGECNCRGWGDYHEPHCIFFKTNDTPKTQ